MTDLDALTRLAAQYCHRFDDGELDAVLDLFETEAAVEFSGQTHKGRDAMHEFFAAIAAATTGGRHLCVNPEFSVDRETGSGVLDFMLVYAGGKPPMVGRYYDEYRKTDGEWRIAVRRIVPAG